MGFNSSGLWALGAWFWVLGAGSELLVLEPGNWFWGPGYRFFVSLRLLVMEMADGVRVVSWRRPGQLWKSSINIFSVKKADKFSFVLGHLYSESIFPNLDTS